MSQNAEWETDDQLSGKNPVRVKTGRLSRKLFL